MYLVILIPSLRRETYFEVICLKSEREEVEKIRKTDSLVLRPSFRSGVKARRQGGKRCMSMRSEGVILGAGSNPLVPPPLSLLDDHTARRFSTLIFTPLLILTRKLVYALSQLVSQRRPFKIVSIQDWHLSPCYLSNIISHKNSSIIVN